MMHPGIRRPVSFVLEAYRLKRVISSSAPCLYCLAGLGDELLATYVIDRYARETKLRPWILTNRPELYRGHPAISGIVSPVANFRLTKAVLRTFRKRMLRLSYHDQPQGSIAVGPRSKHIVNMMAESIGLSDGASTGDPILKPKLYQPAEMGICDRLGVPKPFVLSHSSSLAGRFAASTKEWTMTPTDNRLAAFWREVSPAIAEQGFALVQIGAREDLALPGSVDLRGKTNLSELIALFQEAAYFVGLEGGLMHLARGLECPSLIIYGGRTTPAQTGYLWAPMSNIVSLTDCSPCWGGNTCQFEHRCMASITLESVIDEFATHFSRYSRARDSSTPSHNLTSA